MMDKRLCPIIEKTLIRLELSQFGNSEELQLLYDDKDEDSLSNSLDVAIKYLGETQNNNEERFSFLLGTI